MLSWSRRSGLLLLLVSPVSGCALSHQARSAAPDAADAPVEVAPPDAEDAADAPDVPVIPVTPGRDLVAGGTVSRSPRFTVVHTTGQSTLHVAPAQSPRFRIHGGLVPVTSQGGSR
jgi:hypothetical protein